MPIDPPSPRDLDLSRVAVVGTTSSGKSTFAAALGRLLAMPFIELDALHWAPGWRERDTETFRDLVARDSAGARWAAAGNYSRARDLILDRATTIFWLDYPLWVNFYRLSKRTARNVATGQVVFSGNVETLSTTFSRDSLFIWLFKSYWQRRRTYGELFKDGHYQQARVVTFRRPRQADVFLAALNGKGSVDEP